MIMQMNEVDSWTTLKRELLCIRMYVWRNSCNQRTQSHDPELLINIGLLLLNAPVTNLLLLPLHQLVHVGEFKRVYVRQIGWDRTDRGHLLHVTFV